MAKKRGSREGFNMSSEIREILLANPSMTGKEVYEAVKEKFPNETINENSCHVAFSNQRAKLGLRKGGKSVKKRKPTKAAAAKKTTKSAASTASTAVRSNTAVDMAALQAAQEFVAAVGGMKRATAALDKLSTLQIG